MFNIIIVLLAVFIYCIIVKKNKALAIGLLAISLTYDFKLNINNFNIYIFDLCYITLMVNQVFLFLTKRTYVISGLNNKLKKWFVLYFYWTIISFLIGVIFIDNVTASVNNFVSLIRYIQTIGIFILVISYDLKLGEIKFIFKLMYLNAIFIAIYGIVQTNYISTIAYDLQLWFGRTYSVFTTTGPNAFSIYIGFFLLTAISFSIEKKLKLSYRILNFILLSIFAYPFVYSFSRTGYVALFLSIAFLLLLKRKVYLPVYIFIVGLIVSNGLIYDRLIGYTLSNGLDVSSIGRLEYWKAALQTILHYPISGVGFNGFSIIGLEYTTYFDSLINVHNQYLQTLLNSGAVGFILFLIILIKLFSRGMKVKGKDTDLLVNNIASIYTSSIILLAISCFFFSPFLNYQLIGQFWMASALLLNRLLELEGIEITKSRGYLGASSDK